MTKGDKVAVVCCSNGQVAAYKDKLSKLDITLKDIGLTPVWSDYIYQKDGVASGTAAERAHALMKFYKDDEIKAVFDISGGDIANEILDYLDYDVIAKSDKMFWGYSDLTTIINAICAKTGKASVLYQVRNLIYNYAEIQIDNFTNTVMNQAKDLFDFEYEFVQGKKMSGIVVGGNIRCLLKLAGTKYWPDTKGKILLLEALSAQTPQVVTLLSQLKQMGVFENVAGILLGTFTKMEEAGLRQTVIDLVKEFVGEQIPIAFTREIGHGTDSKGIVIGKEISLD